MNTSARSLILAAGGLLLYSQAHAQNIQPALPGSVLKMSEAAKLTDIIVTGTLESLGPGTPTSPGESTYPSATIKVDKILRGTPMSELLVCVSIRSDKEEITPKVGKAYIFFITIVHDSKRNLASKMLPADDATINAVTAAIAAIF